MIYSKRSLAFALAIAAVIPWQAEAITIYGVTASRDLVTFDSSSPGTIATTTPISGLVDQASFESVIGIDFSPAGELYALGNAPGSIYRVYTLNVGTGVATQVGSSIPLTGSMFGFDYDPESLFLRIMADANGNSTFDAVGAFANKTALAYSAADPNFGQDPEIVGLAQNNNVIDAANSTSYMIDSGLNILTLSGSPSGGQLGTIGPLGFNIGNFVGFDIGYNEVAYLTDVNFVAAPSTNLYTVDLATGAALLVGQVGAELFLNDITAAPVPEPSCFAMLGLGLVGWAMQRRTNRRLA